MNIGKFSVTRPVAVTMRIAALVLLGYICLLRLPIDLLPEAFLAGAGYMDDLVVAAAVLSQAFGGELEPYARKHWSGPEDIRVVLKDITESAQALLGQNIYDRVRRVMSRRGIRVD